MAFIQKVEAEAPVVTGNTASIRIKAIVSQDRNNKRPAEGEEVVFFLGIDEKGREDTNDLGHAITTIVNIPVTDKPQTFKLAACLPGDTTKKYSDVITIPADGSKSASKPVATKLRLDPDEGAVDPIDGKLKHYKVAVFVLTEDDKPVPGTAVSFCFEAETDAIKTPADAGQVLYYTADVYGYNRRAILSAKLPNGKSCCVPLFGPRKPKPDPGPLPAGSTFWEAAKHALKGGHR